MVERIRHHWFTPSAPLIQRVRDGLTFARGKQEKTGSADLSQNEWLGRVLSDGARLKSFVIESVESFVVMLASDARAHGQASLIVIHGGQITREVALRVFEHIPAHPDHQSEFLTLLSSDLITCSRGTVDIGVGRIQGDGTGLVVALDQMPSVPKRKSRVSGKVLDLH
jgi:hypothetical protein